MDYSGFMPDEHQAPVLRALDFPKPSRLPDPAASFDNELFSIRDLTDYMSDQTDSAREKILRNLIENPGLVATLGNELYIELAPLEIHTSNSPEIDPLNEVHIEIVQKWRIRRRKEEDGPGTSLGGDPGGEARTD